VKVGDLVKIKGTSMVHLVMRIDVIESNLGRFHRWVTLHGQPVPYKASKVKVVSASR
jgi:hypothetical protein